MKKLYSFIASSLFVLALHPSAFSQITITFQQGVNGYNGTSDTYFQSGDPLQIRGAEQEWEWDGSDAGGKNFGALRFDNIIGTGSNQIPANSTVVRAFLTLTVTNEGNAAEIASVHDLLKPFSEDADFIDFSANFEPVPGDDYAAEVVAQIPGPAAGDIIEVDVTSSLRRLLSGAQNLGWMFVPAPAGTNGVGIQSSELVGSVVPQLIITTPNGIFTFENGRNGYTGTVDTWINTGTLAADPQGGDDDFEWDGSDNGGSNFGLLRFENIFGSGANQIPLGTSITNARIILTIIDPGNVGEFHEILEGSADAPTNFDETTAMLDFGDGFEPIAGVEYSVDVVDTIEGVNGTQEVDVTSTIQKYSSGEPNRGWIITPTGGGGVVAVSSERASGGEGGPAKLTVIIEGQSTAVHDFPLY